MYHAVSIRMNPKILSIYNVLLILIKIKIQFNENSN